MCDSFSQLGVDDGDEVLKWIIDNDADDLIQQMGHIIFDPGGLTFSGGMDATTASEVQGYNDRAQALLEEQVVTGILSDENLNMAWVADDTRDVRSRGLHRTVSERISKLRWKGADPNQMTMAAAEYEHKKPLLDLLSHGVRSFTRPDFVPNGGVGYRQSKSYRDNRACCNWHTFNLREEGKALIIPWDELSTEEKTTVHVNTWILAPAHGKPNGRCCLNGSSKIQGNHSLNTGMDLQRSDVVYPPTKLPTLVDICQLAQEARSRADAQDEKVVGAVVDVAGAYNQITLSVEAAMHRTVMIYIGPESIPHLCFILVNNFGDSRAGHVYNIAGAFIAHHHNSVSGGGQYTRSETYIDDGVMIDTESQIEQSRLDYRQAVRLPFGPLGIAPKKDVYMGEDLVCLGWHFNLRKGVWRVAPKLRGIEKMYTFLYHVLPIDATDMNKEVQVSRRSLRSLASLLSWYSAVLRVGRPFVHSIFKNLGYGAPDQKIVLSRSAKRDIAFWRVVVLASMKNPHCMSAKINHLVLSRGGDLCLTADASKLIGGGAWLSESVMRFDRPVDPELVESARGSRPGLTYLGTTVSDEASGEILRQGYIRWTKEELSLFSLGISDNFGNMISLSSNVLEYFVVMHFILVWGRELKEKTFAVNCDNTAAVSWLLKMRGSNKSPVAESLVKLFVLFCTSMDITLLPMHLSGALNTHADNLSRLSIYQENSELLVDTKEETWWLDLPREAVCRSLLKASVLEPSSMPLPKALELLKSLL